MSRGIVFLNVGTRYAVPLAVSLATLRQHYSGPVAILCDHDSGHQTTSLIASDTRLQPISVIPRREMRVRFLERSEPWIYLLKTKLPSLSPFAETIILDSDTLVVGDISELWPKTPDEVVLTKRYGGRHQNLKARLRCQKWEHVDRRRALRARERTYKYPPINTGIMSFGSESQDFQAEWRRMVEANPIHSCDEQAAQLIYPDFNCRLVDRRYNASTAFDRETEDVKIWHGVGHRFWLKDKDLWLPYFARAAKENIGNVLELVDTMRWSGNKMMGHLWRAANHGHSQGTGN